MRDAQAQVSVSNCAAGTCEALGAESGSPLVRGAQAQVSPAVLGAESGAAQQLW